MRVMIKGEAQTLRDGVTIAHLITELGLNQRRIAVEINREIIARDAYAARALAPDDEVEIVHFVGGG